jgi:hypothetical protein
MYIVQPENNAINAQMQEVVIKKHGKKKDSPKNVKKAKLEVEDTKEEFSTIKVEKNETELENAKKQNEDIKIEEKPKRQRKTRKPISQMSIPEKIEFFTTLPKNMPKSLCLIETTEESYRGVIISQEEGTVTIRALNHQKPIDIPLENINGITVLGF